MNTALAIHRLHFAFTITFHYLFPQLTMGLALLIVILKTWRCGPATSTTTARALLGQDLRHQLRHRRGDRHSDGIPVRHQLGALLAARRRSDRQTLAMEGVLLVLSRVDVPRPVSLRREAAEPEGALVVGRYWCFWVRGCRDSSSSPPMPGCSIPWATRWAADGSLQLTSFWELILNPWAWWQYRTT